MKIFRDPIHNVIDLDTGDKAANRLIIRLIDSTPFQRLRHIKQLGFVYFAFPSAMHTRFEHSIGVAFLAKRFLDKIISLEEKVLSAHTGASRALLTDFFARVKKDKAATIIAALLHDIGHGPLSHVFEYISGIKHERWVKEIILGDSPINALLAEHSPDFPALVHDILFRSDASPPSAQIIAGQIDIDKIDYLLRDSHMTGSGYGKFDVEWLINVITVGVVHQRVIIGLESGKGFSVAEDFVMARIYMFKNIYFHKTGMVAQIMLKRLVKRMAEGTDTAYPADDRLRRVLQLDPKNDALGEVLSDYLAVSDIDLYSLLNSLQNASDPVLGRLAGGVMNRRLFKQVSQPEYERFSARVAKNEGEAMVPYYTATLELNHNKISYQPEEDEIFLFDKNGESFGLGEKTSIIPIEAKANAFPTEYFKEASYEAD